MPDLREYGRGINRVVWSDDEIDDESEVSGFPFILPALIYMMDIEAFVRSLTLLDFFLSKVSKHTFWRKVNTSANKIHFHALMISILFYAKSWFTWKILYAAFLLSVIVMNLSITSTICCWSAFPSQSSDIYANHSFSIHRCQWYTRICSLLGSHHCAYCKHFRCKDLSSICVDYFLFSRICVCISCLLV